jgi:hypothetical protein
MFRKCTAGTVENFHTCQIGKMPLLGGTKNLCIDGLKLHDKHQEHLLCVKHWFMELDDPQANACPSQAFADTPIGQSLFKLDESQRTCLESLFNTAYGVVKAGKPFSDYELICEIQVKNGLDLGKNYRNINDCKNFTESIAQTLVDKQVQFQILSYKLGLGKSLTGIRLKKFKKPCPKKISTSGSYKISS